MELGLAQILATETALIEEKAHELGRLIKTRKLYENPTHTIGIIESIYSAKLRILGEFLKSALGKAEYSVLYPAIGFNEQPILQMPGMRSLTSICKGDPSSHYESAAASNGVAFSNIDKKIEQIIPEDITGFDVIIDKGSIELIDLANNNISRVLQEKRRSSTDVYSAIASGMEKGSILTYISMDNKYLKKLEGMESQPGPGRTFDQLQIPGGIQKALTQTQFTSGKFAFDIALDIYYSKLYKAPWDFLGLRTFGPYISFFKKR